MTLTQFAAIFTTFPSTISKLHSKNGRYEVIDCAGWISLLNILLNIAFPHY
jgi:hypothetical protein